MLLLVVAAFVLTPEALQEPAFFGGISLLFVMTGAALLVPWSPRFAAWAVVLPLLDIVAIAAVRYGAPPLGSGLFLIFPVIWMSRHHRLWGAITSVVFATVLLWLSSSGQSGGLFGAKSAALILLPVVLAFIAVSTYVTTRRTKSQRFLLGQQAALVESAFARTRRQERFRNEVLNSVSFGVMAFDRHGAITLMNDSHRQSLLEFHAPPGAVVHETIYESDRITPFTSETRPLSLALRGVAFDEVIIWVGAPGSHRKAFSVTSRGLVGQAGEYDGQVVVMRDVTRELEAIAERDDLVASVSHELRTPITSILGYLELVLETDDLDGEAQKMVDIAHRNSERLLVLVGDLTHASSEAGTTPAMVFQPCDISFTVTEAVEALRPAIAGQHLNLETDIQSPARTVADALRIRQVVDNLLTNAVKYNREGGVISVSVRDDGSSLVIAVRDTGVGISEADQERLFERFYRTDSARSSSVHGSGLGLAITKDIVQQHGGELTVASVLGEGTTISVSLPSLGASFNPLDSTRFAPDLTDTPLDSISKGSP